MYNGKYWKIKAKKLLAKTEGFKHIYVFGVDNEAKKKKNKQEKKTDKYIAIAKSLIKISSLIARYKHWDF